MIPPKSRRTLETGGAHATAAFGISSKDTAHVMGLLREGLYTDRIKAVLREYATNAWDAHRSSGRGDVPIEVTLPTAQDPTLSIRDHGPGMSHADVMTVYTQYGASTRRDSNDVVGMMGIGSKSAFSYVDSFTIISQHQGIRRLYIATLGEDNIGEIRLMDERLAEAGAHGLEIRINVRHTDIAEFTRKAQPLFEYFEPRPIINTLLPAIPHESTALASGRLYASSTYEQTSWVAVMGCVPYRIDLNQLPQDELSASLQKLSGCLFFDIGEVQISASREELKYSATTKQALVAKLDALLDEYVSHTLAGLAGLSGWEQHLRMQVFGQLKLDVPDLYKDLIFEEAKLIYEPTDLTMIRNRSACTRIAITRVTRLLLHDTPHELAGYHLGHHDYVIRPADGRTVAETRTLLEAALKASRLDGLQIELLSTVPYTPPYVKPKKGANPKHKISTFTLKPQRFYNHPYSNHWLPETRTPSPKDVYVLITNFKATDYKHFFKDYPADAELAKAFDIELPTIYGYKTTATRPRDPATLQGVAYEAWRKTLPALILAAMPSLVAEIAAVHWTALIYNVSPPHSKQLAELETKLGARHPIVEVFTQYRTMSTMFSNQPNRREHLRDLAACSTYTFAQSAASAAIDKLYAQYPLFGEQHIRLSVLWERNGDLWVDYVKLCDRDRSMNIASATASMQALLATRTTRRKAVNGKATTTSAANQSSIEQALAAPIISISDF